jgi:hypothetical protein
MTLIDEVKELESITKEKGGQREDISVSSPTPIEQRDNAKTQ